jgi:hypothetical protein
MEPQIQELLKRVDRLSDDVSELRDGILKAVRVADDDPEMALIRARKVLEFVIRDVFERRVGESPGTRPLENLIQRLAKDGHLPARLEAYTETIRKLGNVGAHRFGEAITATDVYQSLAQLLPILEWYLEKERPEAGIPSEPPARAAAETARPMRTSFDERARPWYRRNPTTLWIAVVAGVILAGLSALLARAWFSRSTAHPQEPIAEAATDPAPVVKSAAPDASVKRPNPSEAAGPSPPSRAQGGPAAGVEIAKAGDASTSTTREHRAPTGAGRAARAGFVPLFNGKDTSGWRVLGNTRHSWKVTGGILEGSSGPPPASVLTTERTDFANFHLRVETMLPEGIGAGIQFRMTETGTERPSHYAATIAPARSEGKKSLRETGSLVFAAMPGPNITLADADPIVPIKSGEWFVEEVIADGDVITVLVRGIEVARFQILHRKLTSGAIGLSCQFHSNVLFRKIEIKELDGPGKASSPTSAIGSSEDPETADLSHVATSSRGQWQIEAGQVVHKSLDEDAGIFFGDATWSDYTFSADVFVAEGTGHAGLYFRHGGLHGNGNYFYTVCPPGGGPALLRRFFDGDFKVLASRRSRDAPLATGKWHKMKVDVHGHQFTAYLDDKEILTASDDAVPMGAVGLTARESVCRFRNLKVTAPGGRILWEGSPKIPTSRSIGVSLRSH